VTKAVIEVNEPEQASEAMARAFHIARAARRAGGVILPEDIFDEETEAELNPPGRASARAARGGFGGSPHAGERRAPLVLSRRAVPRRCTTRRCSPI